jgi:hypothetical protein
VYRGNWAIALLLMLLFPCLNKAAKKGPEERKKKRKERKIRKKGAGDCMQLLLRKGV